MDAYSPKGLRPYRASQIRALLLCPMHEEELLWQGCFIFPHCHVGKSVAELVMLSVLEDSCNHINES